LDAIQKDGWEHLTFGKDNEESRERLRELVLFIAERCQDDPTFGATKLNKILFFADFVSFARFGESITGTPYSKLPLGPVPRAVRTVRAQMEAKGEIFITKEGYSPYLRDRVIPLREANLDKLKARDIALIDGVIQAFHGVTATDVSKLSHDRAWKAAEWYETIPYEAAFVSDEPLTERDVIIAHEMIEEYERAK
jgi:Protein of unknown function (DUF4065)